MLCCHGCQFNEASICVWLHSSAPAVRDGNWDVPSSLPDKEPSHLKGWAMVASSLLGFLSQENIPSGLCLPLSGPPRAVAVDLPETGQSHDAHQGCLSP